MLYKRVSRGRDVSGRYLAANGTVANDQMSLSRTFTIRHCS